MKKFLLCLVATMSAAVKPVVVKPVQLDSQVSLSKAVQFSSRITNTDNYFYLDDKLNLLKTIKDAGISGFEGKLKTDFKNWTGKPAQKAKEVDVVNNKLTVEKTDLATDATNDSEFALKLLEFDVVKLVPAFYQIRNYFRKVQNQQEYSQENVSKVFIDCIPFSTIHARLTELYRLVSKSKEEVKNDLKNRKIDHSGAILSYKMLFKGNKPYNLKRINLNTDLVGFDKEEFLEQVEKSNLAIKERQITTGEKIGNEIANLLQIKFTYNLYSFKANLNYNTASDAKYKGEWNKPSVEITLNLLNALQTGRVNKVRESEYLDIKLKTLHEASNLFRKYENEIGKHKDSVLNAPSKKEFDSQYEAIINSFKGNKIDEKEFINQYNALVKKELEIIQREVCLAKAIVSLCCLNNSIKKFIKEQK